jgi:hypothetical protein
VNKEDKHMDDYSNDSNLLIWVMALVITGFMFGCGAEVEVEAAPVTSIAMMAGASIDGRLLAGTAVNLDTDMLVQP